MGAINIFLDTNVLVDFFTGRMGNDDAKKIILCGKTEHYNICVSILTVVNTIFIAKKGYGKVLHHRDIEKVCTILGQRIEQWKTACNLTEMSDFEDAVQTACAIDNRCTIVISRDEHFKNCPLTVYSPKNFLEKIQAN